MTKTELSQLLDTASHLLAAAAHLMEVGRIDAAKDSAHQGIANATFALEMGAGLSNASRAFKSPPVTCFACGGSGKR